MSKELETLKESLKVESSKLDLELSISKLRRQNNWKIKKLDMSDDKRHYISLFIEIIFYIGIICSTLFLFWYLIGWQFYHIYESVFGNNGKYNYFEAIEMVFIAPLPLIIIFTFYNYYTKVFKISLFDKAANSDEDQQAIMRDISITKYLFVSILISTIIILFIEYLRNFLIPTGGVKINSQTNTEYLLYGLGGGVILLVFLIVYLNQIAKHVNDKK